MDDPEKTALLDYLSAQRKHVLGVLEGLDDEQLRRPVLPSGWSCLGLVQHLALDVERFWFTAVAAADPEAMAFFRAGPPDAWVVAPEVPADAVLAGYRAEIERADAAINRIDLTAGIAWWPGPPGSWSPTDLRDVLLHVIVETACHAGHLDAVRELLDGRQWMVLD